MQLRPLIRQLTSRPAFTIAAVLSLAIGIGANTAIFSVVNAILLRERPLERPEELVDIFLSTPDYDFSVLSYPDYEDLRDGSREVFTGVAVSRIVLAQSEHQGEIDMLPGEVVSGNFFSLLGITAAHGRMLQPEDDSAPGAHPVVVLGHDYWQSRFAGDPDVVGRTLRLGGLPYEIVGVAPQAYAGYFRGLVPSFYAPTMMVDDLNPGESSELENRGNHSMFAKGRLRPGVDHAQALTTLQGIAARLAEEDTKNWDPQTSFKLVPTEDVVFFPPLDRYIHAAAWLLMVAVGLVLLVVCMNLASFLLARAIDRRREIALRMALGASRSSLLSQLLAETLILSVVSGVVGATFAVLLLRLLAGADLPLPLPLTFDFGIDARVLAFCIFVSVLAGVLLALVPAYQSTNPNLIRDLKIGIGSNTGGKRWSMRGVLVATQVAVSTVLLVGAGLFLRSMQRAQDIDPGFGREPAALLDVVLPPVAGVGEAESRQIMDRLRERLARGPGVEAVGLISNLHLNTLSTSTTDFEIDGLALPEGRESFGADTAVVDSGFFSAAGIRFLEGRNFEDRDHADSSPVVVVNDAFAERFFPQRSAVGQRIVQKEASPEIVGVVETAKIRGIGEEPRPFVYFPFSQDYTSYATLVARTSGDADRLAIDMVRTVREVDPTIWLWQPRTMERHLSVVLLPARLSALVLTCFAAVALLLAAIGLYGIVSYAVAQRTREVGIRVSLGADRSSIVGLLMRSGLRLVLVGTVVGFVVAAAVTRVLGSMLFASGRFDWPTFLAVGVTLLSTALLAAFLPARRAAGLDPVRALRSE